MLSNTDINEIVTLFESLVGDNKKLLYYQPVFDNKGVKTRGVIIFDGELDSSIKIATLVIHGMHGKFSAELMIDFNTFHIFDGPELMKKLILELVKVPEHLKTKQLNESSNIG